MIRYEIKPCEGSCADFIEEKLCEEDYSIVPRVRDAEELVFKIEDGAGNIIGGCVLDIDAWSIPQFNSLWVDEAHRRRGLGSVLIREAERAARSHGCRAMINAYCFDFQAARPLFEKNGYSFLGSAPDWPPGHEGYYLAKRLGDERRDVPSGGSVIRSGGEADGGLITKRLAEYNNSMAPRTHSYIGLDKKLVDGEGNITGGCIAGVSGWDALHVDEIWVDKAHRGLGLGSRLLSELEREAAALGARTALLTACDWQTALFKRNGYAVCAEIDDCPAGHSLVYMQKRL